jgi:chromate transporter
MGAVASVRARGAGFVMPSLTQIAILFARYANLTLGGGSVIAAILHRELVEKREWLTEHQFMLCFALGRVTPGTNLLALSTGFGWVMRGPAGAVIALLASCIPCAVLVAVLSVLLNYWRSNQLAQAAIHGAVAAAVGITTVTCWMIFKPHFRGRERVPVVLIAVSAFALYVWGGIPPIEVLIIAGVVGIFLPEPRT